LQNNFGPWIESDDPTRQKLRREWLEPRLM
jgi:hypothetical protein